jgi:hypothetical protein
MATRCRTRALQQANLPEDEYAQKPLPDLHLLASASHRALSRLARMRQDTYLSLR